MVIVFYQINQLLSPEVNEDLSEWFSLVNRGLNILPEVKVIAWLLVDVITFCVLFLKVLSLTSHRNHFR